MSSGPKNVTQTTSAEPPAFLLPALTTATNAAVSNFNRSTGGGGFGGGGFGGGFGTGFGGGFGAGFAPSVGDGFGGLSTLDSPIGNLFRRATGISGPIDPGTFQPGIGGLPLFRDATGITDPNLSGRGGSFVGGFGPGQVGGLSPTGLGPTFTTTAPPRGDATAGLIPQAGDLVSQTIGGQFLTPETNPFLESTFNRAADLTRTRLASEFAGSGRNLGAAAPARSEELQTLAASIFGPNFQAERDRQLSALQLAQGLDPTNLLINRISGLIPGAGGVTSSTQPVQRDRFGQFLGAGLGLLSLFPGLIPSDKRLKSNIRRIGTVKGHAWYEFDILGKRSQGVMSDEVPEKFVIKGPLGYDMVDYGALLWD